MRVDDYEGATALMHHLLSLGHRDIGFIKGDRSHTPAQLRYRAYLDACTTASLPVHAERVAEGMFTYRSGLAAARQLLEQSNRPSAVFACDDDMAAAVIAVAHGMRARTDHHPPADRRDGARGWRSTRPCRTPWWRAVRP